MRQVSFYNFIKDIWNFVTTLSYTNFVPLISIRPIFITIEIRKNIMTSEQKLSKSKLIFLPF